jgi:hypothetical protein
MIAPNEAIDTITQFMRLRALTQADKSNFFSVNRSKIKKPWPRISLDTPCRSRSHLPGAGSGQVLIQGLGG